MRLLGFSTLREACSVIGTALGVSPRSVRNYRDEFDPVLSDKREGWKNRPMRPPCKAMLDTYGEMTLSESLETLKRLVYRNSDADVMKEKIAADEADDSSFARRLITGQAAEEYFRKHYRKIPEFSDLRMQDTTGMGCGFDFRLSADDVAYGVEVKGIRAPTGSIVLTDKEHRAAAVMRKNFFLFVVKNLAEAPAHEMHRDPINGSLQFRRAERRLTQVSWTTAIH